ncbi:hypothetical protein SO802_017571 [Lithocarpus litseifolius]|uniref:Uncharacterized protein n=1 Tax=Lithocarpus litseifolius TaxID=425828 RepID=A0AAW2CKD3_9ROSI
MGYLCQASPAASAPIDPPHLPWSVYVYGLDGFSCERAGKVKLEMNEYFRQIYGLGGFPYPGDDDDDGGDQEATPSYKLRKRHHY